MSGYMPRVGDRVRATLGENVLVGSVQHVNSEILRFDIGDPANYYVSIALDDGWQFEQLVELPTKLGAIIQLHRGVPFLLVHVAENKWWAIPSGVRFTNTDVLDEAGFTVLFEGVNE